MVAYIASLTWPLVTLWCYLSWYVVIATLYFDPLPTLWLSSVGISGIIGTSLVLSTGQPISRLGGWSVFRLYLTPFCVSSYAALGSCGFLANVPFAQEGPPRRII